MPLLGTLPFVRRKNIYWILKSIEIFSRLSLTYFFFILVPISIYYAYDSNISICSAWNWPLYSNKIIVANKYQIIYSIIIHKITCCASLYQQQQHLYYVNAHFESTRTQFINQWNKQNIKIMKRIYVIK